MFLEAHIRPQPERAGRLRAGAVGHGLDLLQQRRREPGHSDERRGQPGGLGLSGLPFLFPECDRPQPGLLRGPGAQRARSRPSGTARGWRRCRRFTWGGRDCQRPAEHRLPGLVQHQLDQRLLHQPDEGPGPAHLQERLLQHPQLQGGADEQQRVRHDQLQRRRRLAPTRSTPRSGSPTPRSARSSSYTQAQKYVETNSVYNNTEWYIQDNWKAEPQADTRLRAAVRPPAGAVRQARAGVELPARQVVAGGRARRSTCRAAPTRSPPEPPAPRPIARR